jgi:agmatine/peptidylarginine deiminase
VHTPVPDTHGLGREADLQVAPLTEDDADAADRVVKRLVPRAELIGVDRREVVLGAVRIVSRAVPSPSASAS